MHPDHFVGAGCASRDLGYRDGAGVRGEDSIRLGDAVDVGEDAELEAAVLAGCFDDERGMRERICTCSSGGIVPFFTCRSMFFAIVARPLSSASCETSIITTVNPDCANTCAIPFPI